MYNGNLLKVGHTHIEGDGKRVIDTNELVTRRLEEQAQRELRRQEAALEREGSLEEDAPENPDAEAGGEPEDGFVPGLKAEEVEDPLVVKAREDAEKIMEEAREKAEAEREKLKAKMLEDIYRERDELLEKAKEEGYSAGLERAERELEAEREKLREQLREKEQEYQGILDSMEPQFIDAITGIYEHIFHVELASYRDVLVYLISSTLRKVEGARDFLVHVSQEDYPYVSMQKKEILAGAASPNCTVEIIEDITLGKNECMIETDNGIFDCGLGTQLAEVRKKLQLLSYEK